MEPLVTSATSIEQLYQEYHQPILRHLERLVHHHETAEDLCQETFLKALRSWNQHDSSASVRGWLYRIATNTAYDYLRRQRRIVMTPLNHDVILAPQLETHQDDAEQMWTALNQIPDHYRVTLLLQFWAGYSLHDIATALQVNVATVKTRVYRGRVQFRQHYVA